MEPSYPNDNGVYPATSAEIVARHGRSFAEIRFAYCDDGHYRFSLSMQYSYGGYGGPISTSGPAYPSLAAARAAALESLIERWPTWHSAEPASVHEELRRMREQVTAQLSQPTLF